MVPRQSWINTKNKNHYYLQLDQFIDQEHQYEHLSALYLSDNEAWYGEARKDGSRVPPGCKDTPWRIPDSSRHVQDLVSRKQLEGDAGLTYFLSFFAVEFYSWICEAAKVRQ
jgi:hypothetical protein